MNYQTYLEMAMERIADGRLPKTFKSMSEMEFQSFIKPTEATPPVQEQRGFVLAYELIYKRLKRLFKGTEHEKEIDKIYHDSQKDPSVEEPK